MSWDVALKTVEGRFCVEISNYTYNVANMYKKAMGMTLSGLNDKQAEVAIEILESGIQNMTNNPDEYKEMNPENGWGNYEGALEFLKSIQNTCRHNPDLYLSVF